MTQTKKRKKMLPQVTRPAGMPTGATTNLGSSGLAGNSGGSFSSNQRPTMAIGLAKAGNYIGSSSGGTLLASLGSGIMNMISGAINRRWQKKDYELQRKDALSDYSMQREDYLSDLADERSYNSPAAQRERLLAAGINPNTAFGNGSIVNTSSSAQNQANIRGVDMGSPARLGSLGSEMVDTIMPTMQASLTDLQAESLREDIAIKKANVLRILSETKGIDASTKAKLIENGYLDAMLSTNIEEKRSNIARVSSQLKTDEIERAQLTFNLEKLSPLKVKQVNAEINKAWSEINSLTYDLNFRREYKRFYGAQVRNNARLASSQASYYDSQKFESESRKVLNDLEAQLKQIGLPTDKVDAFIQGSIHRLQLLTDAISPIDF